MKNIGFNLLGSLHYFDVQIFQIITNQTKPLQQFNFLSCDMKAE